MDILSCLGEERKVYNTYQISLCCISKRRENGKIKEGQNRKFGSNHTRLRGYLDGAEKAST